uniref:ST8 alpha-N-acetyl-neuraminide alpha-2,8-sialyltransferase 6 n=1 Tax=Paramormyrops kingsleyae TaxID=1676925 RepID=A0A3B3QER3_9TELE
MLISYSGIKVDFLAQTQSIFFASHSTEALRYSNTRPLVLQGYLYVLISQETFTLCTLSCGKNIDLAQFVIRCNLGTLNNGYDKHVGKKTNLISFNPSILTEHYGALIDYRRPFVNRLDLYKDALLLLPTFPYQRDTAVSLCAYYTLNDFDSSIRAVLYNPEYLRNLMTRLSTGIMMVSLGVEMCDDVQVYGFWPFPVHPNDCRPITNRYYDNRPWKRKFHVMPDEFHQLLRLHNMGVLKLHLGRCIPGRE